MKNRLLNLTRLALVSGLLVATIGANAQTTLQAKKASAGTLLRLPDELSDPNPDAPQQHYPQSETGTTGGWWEADRLVVFPNPVVGNLMNIAAPESGLMQFDLVGLAGPYIGKSLPLILDNKYVGKTRKTFVVPSYIYSGQWLMVGRVGKQIYNQQITIIR